MQTVIEVRDGQVITNLRRIVRELDNPAPALKITGQLAVRAVQRNFRAQRDPQGKPWARLAAATVARRRNRNKSSIQILIDTGRLRNSIHAEPPSRDEVRVGTGVKYSAIHNFGAGPRSAVKSHRLFGAIPQREFMGVTKEDQAGIVGALNAYVKRMISQSGLR